MEGSQSTPRCENDHQIDRDSYFNEKTFLLSLNDLIEDLPLPAKDQFRHLSLFIDQRGVSPLKHSLYRDRLSTVILNHLPNIGIVSHMTNIGFIQGLIPDSA